MQFIAPFYRLVKLSLSGVTDFAVFQRQLPTGGKTKDETL